MVSDHRGKEVLFFHISLILEKYFRCNYVVINYLEILSDEPVSQAPGDVNSEVDLPYIVKR